MPTGLATGVKSTSCPAMGAEAARYPWGGALKTVCCCLGQNRLPASRETRPERVSQNCGLLGPKAGIRLIDHDVGGQYTFPQALCHECGSKLATIRLESYAVSATTANSPSSLLMLNNHFSNYFGTKTQQSSSDAAQTLIEHGTRNARLQAKPSITRSILPSQIWEASN